MAEEKPFLICAEVASFAGQVPLGSVRGICSQCYQPVWIAPTGQEWVGRAILICLGCTKKLPKTPEDEVLRLNEEQRLEIARETGMYGDELDRFVQYVERELGFRERKVSDD